MSERSGGQLVVDQLTKEGVQNVFCVPGESYLQVLDALHDSPIQLVVCRHEGGAGYMADAHARITNSTGVFMVTRGPGAANAMSQSIRPGKTACRWCCLSDLFRGLKPTVNPFRNSTSRAGSVRPQKRCFRSNTPSESGFLVEIEITAVRR